jgi:hypothetical protein
MDEVLCECGHPKSSHDDGSTEIQVDDAVLPRPGPGNINTDEPRGKTRCKVKACICLTWRPRHLFFSFGGKAVAKFLADNGYATHPKGMAASVCESDGKTFWLDVNADAVRRKNGEVPDRPLRITVHNVSVGGGKTRLEMKSVEELALGVKSTAMDRQPETLKMNAPWPD